MVATGLRRRIRLAFKQLMYGGPRRARWQHPERVVAALDLRPGDRVADLGAGGGFFTFPLAAAVGTPGRVYAIDPDPDSATVIEQRRGQEDWPQVHTVTPAPDRTGLPEPVDLALMVNAFHHLPDPAAYLRGVAPHLRPGGRLAVIEPYPGWLRFGHATAPETIRSILAGAGLTRVDSHDFLPYQSFQVFSPTTGPNPGPHRG